MFKKIIMAFVPCALCGAAYAAGEMEENFLNPPDSARPGVYWYFLNGSLNGKEMTADLESMKAAGLGNLTFLEVDIGEPPGGPVVFHFPHYTHATGPNSVLVENDWKLIRFYNDETGRYLLFNLAKDLFEQHDLSAAMPDKARALDERLTQLLDGMKAQMPRMNPDFDPKAGNLFNRKFTLDLAIREHQINAARFKAAGLSLPPGAEAEN